MLAAAATALIAGCALDPVYRFQPGVATAQDVRGFMGEPKLHWTEGDGGQLWVYSTGPMGRETYRVHLDKSDRVATVEKMLNDRGFAQVQVNKSNEEDVRRLYGVPGHVTRFDRRNEIVWDYRFRDEWTEPAIFHVIFDDRGIVKQTFQTREFFGDSRQMP
jgi:hypothetical protein